MPRALPIVPLAFLVCTIEPIFAAGDETSMESTSTSINDKQIIDISFIPDFYRGLFSSRVDRIISINIPAGNSANVGGFEIGGLANIEVTINGTAKEALVLHPGILDIEYVISMPAQYNLIVKTSGGSLSLSGMQGSTSASTTGGNVSIEDMVGPQEVKTSGGWISAKNIIGDLIGTTTGGSISIRATE
jgi:hypothetical protein